MKKIIAALIVTVWVVPFLFAGEAEDVEKEKAAIKKVILSAYRDGICNVGDVALIKEGFHPGFNLLGMNKDRDDLWKRPIYSWAKSVAKNKEAGKYPPKEKVSFKFPLIEVTGTAAVAKVQYYRGEKLAYSDFLSLYKFKKGWRIVSKIYYQHQ
jgi:hypothetical protein